MKQPVFRINFLTAKYTKFSFFVPARRDIFSIAICHSYPTVLILCPSVTHSLLSLQTYNSFVPQIIPQVSLYSLTVCFIFSLLVSTSLLTIISYFGVTFVILSVLFNNS